MARRSMDEFQKATLKKLRELAGLSMPNKVSHDYQWSRPIGQRSVFRVQWLLLVRQIHDTVELGVRDEQLAKGREIERVAQLLGLEVTVELDAYTWMWRYRPTSTLPRGVYVIVTVSLPQGQRELLPQAWDSPDVEELFAVCERDLTDAVKSGKTPEEADLTSFLILADALEEMGCNRKHLLKALREKKGCALCLVPEVKRETIPVTGERKQRVVRGEVDFLGCRVGTQAASINAALDTSWRHPETIASRSGAKMSAVRSHLTRLYKDGLIEKSPSGWYRLKSA